MKYILGWVICIFFSVSSSLSFAGFDEGLEAYNNQNYELALKEFTPMAEQGDDSAQNALGAMFQFGYGVKKDENIAVTWYSKAAEHGNPTAQFNLGAMLLNKHKGLNDIGSADKEKNYKQAAFWFEKSAEQGDENAQNALGILYLYGTGETQEDSTAISWFEKSAKQGNEQAHQNLESARRVQFVRHFMSEQPWERDENLKDKPNQLKYISKTFVKLKKIDSSVILNGYAVTGFEILPSFCEFIDVMISNSNCAVCANEFHVLRFNVTEENHTLFLLPQKYTPKSKYVDPWWQDFKNEQYQPPTRACRIRSNRAG